MNSLDTCKMHRLTLIVPIVLGLCGCQKTPEDIRAGIVANKEISDQEAIEQLAQSIFKGLKGHSTSVDKNGDVSLKVLVQLSDDAEVTTIRGGPSAADVDAGVVLGLTVFDARKLIRYGRQRALGELEVELSHAAENEQGETVDVDVFDYSVPKDRFDKFLNTGSALDIAKGGAKKIIEETCIVNYDHFGDLQYTEVE